MFLTVIRVYAAKPFVLGRTANIRLPLGHAREGFDAVQHPRSIANAHELGWRARRIRLSPVSPPAIHPCWPVQLSSFAGYSNLLHYCIFFTAPSQVVDSPDPRRRKPGSTEQKTELAKRTRTPQLCFRCNNGARGERAAVMRARLCSLRVLPGMR